MRFDDRLLADVRRQRRARKNAARVLVLVEVVEGDRAIQTARGDDRNLALERAEAFKYARRTKLRIRAFGVSCCLDPDLPAPVITKTARLQDRRRADLENRRVQIVL